MTFKKKSLSLEIHRQRLVSIAEEMGAVGIRVEDPSEIKGALEKALKMDRPVIIDVVTDIDAQAPLAVS